MQFHILTLFPDVIESYFHSSIIGRAVNNKIFHIFTYNIRKWGIGKNKSVDDSPYGGGPGMVLKVDPIYNAVKHIKKKISNRQKPEKTIVLLFSTRGKKLDDNLAKKFLKYDNVILICGRYEGVDERVAKHIADEEISIGDYILSGGELPAMVFMDAVVRKISGVLGNKKSLEEVNGSYKVYTRPEVFYPNKKKEDMWKVPDVFISGNHKKIKEARER